MKTNSTILKDRRIDLLLVTMYNIISVDKTKK
jgi:hypothetical protein